MLFLKEWIDASSLLSVFFLVSLFKLNLTKSNTSMEYGVLSVYTSSNRLPSFQSFAFW